MITVLLSAQKNIALTLSVYRFDTKTETVYLSFFDCMLCSFCLLGFVPLRFCVM